MADQVTQTDIVNQETDGANAAQLINDTKRAINEVIVELEDFVSESDTIIEEEFTGIIGQSIINFVYTPNFLDVFYNGSKLALEDFTANDGLTITLADPVGADDDIIVCKAYRSFSAGDGITQADADGRYLKKSSNLAELVSPTAARTNLGLGSASLVDTGLLTGNVPTANQLSMVGQTVNYTGANYQPDIFDGLGSKTRLYNIGPSVSSAATVAGTNLKTYKADNSGVVSTLAFMSGTYVSSNGGTVLQNNSGDFTKVSN